MNFLRKGSLLLLFALVVVVVLHSCKEDAPEILSSGVHQLELDLAQLDNLNTVNGKSDKLVFVKNSHVLVDTEKYSENAIEGLVDHVEVLTSEVQLSYLNTLFPGLPVDINVMTLTYFKDSNGAIDGLVLHYANGQGQLKLEAYQKVEGNHTFSRLPFQANLVSNFTLDNLLYVSRMLFPSRDIYTIGGSAIKNFESTNEYDDISLLRFISKYNIPIPGYENLIDRKPTEGQAREAFDAFIEEDGGGRPCALAVHHCNNGDQYRTQCHPFAGGCRRPVTCDYNETISAYDSYGMVSQRNTFMSNLPSNQLYTFRDRLQTEPQGQFYVDAFYSTSNHFSASLNTSLLIDLAARSYDMAQFVNAMVSQQSNYVLSVSDYNSFVQLAQSSSFNSQSLVYQDLVSTIIADTEKYKAKDVQEINSIIESPLLFDGIE